MNGVERIEALLNGSAADQLPCMPITMQFACDFIGAKYLDYATDYRVMAEGQVRTAEAFGFDYVNTMSDPATEAADCGATVAFYPNSPPAIDESNALLLDKLAFTSLAIPDCTAGRMLNRLKALDLLKQRVGGEKQVEGWIEGPCAEAADLRGINNLMVDFIDDPAFVTDLFEFVLAMELEFARHQVAAGAQSIGIGDAAASLVGPRIYEKYVYPFEKRMVDGVHALGARVRLHICGNTRKILTGMGRLGCDIVDLDFLAPVGEGRQAMGPGQILLGNIDPVRVLRNGTPDEVLSALEQCHEEAGVRWICGAGCEVVRDTPHENLKTLVQYASSHSLAGSSNCSIE